MINTNANIDQIIYTACGKDHSGAFSVWSASNDELKQTRYNSEIMDILNTVYAGNNVIEKDMYGNPIRRTFDEQISQDRVLKQGAKPSGLFKKSYKDSDYEIIENVTRAAIKVLGESGSSGLRKQIRYDDDFREDLDKAPFRIAYTKLSDGRLLLCRVAAIGKVYSQLDSRNGNLFYHAYILPKGTKISDINLSKLDFVKGLDKKYWGENPEDAPKYLPTLKINDLYNNPLNSKHAKQEKTQYQSKLLNKEELLDLIKKSVLSQDIKTRLGFKQEFMKQVKLGANIPELLNDVCEKNIKKLENNEKLNDEDYLIIQELEIINTPFSSMFEHMEKYSALKAKRESYDYDDIDVINQQMQTSKQYIKQLMSDMNLEQLMNVADSTKKYIYNSAKFNLLEHNKPANGNIKLSSEEEIKYWSADKLYRATKTMLERKISFDEQKVIL